jgi:pyruvate formate lyase activating enzyme
MKKASYYTTINSNKVECSLCHHQCKIDLDRTGICKVRKNIDGTLYSLVYEKPIAQSIDPIEKKPLFHFQPGSNSYSIATVGCNFKCLHCQNYDISQLTYNIPETPSVSSEQIVENAINAKCKSISYTYTEPTIFYEYAYDISRIAHKKGLKNIFVTNGYISKKPLQDISDYLDAANIDLKSISPDFYKNVCKADLKHVLDMIKIYYDLGIWIEITTLIIPGYNDDENELIQIAEFIKSISEDIPWHVSAFHPDYKLSDGQRTSFSTMKNAVEIGKEMGLKYVYQGNIGQGENTFCPNCNSLLINRSFLRSSENIIKNGKCPLCDIVINGVEL